MLKNNMSDFTKGCIAVLIGWAIVSFLFDQSARLGVYIDQLYAKRIDVCMERGYTFADCYSVIIQGSNKFTK